MAVRSKWLSFAFLCVFALIGIAASLWWPHPRPLNLATGIYFAPAREFEDFSLIDQAGRKFAALNLRGHWSLLFFGYTNCPDFCPTTLTTLAAMQKSLIAGNAAALPQVIFVSVDAQRDTPEQLAKYVPYFDPHFIGLTAADQPTIEAMAKKMGVAVNIRPIAEGNYTVDHSGAIFVLDPDGRLAALLTGPFTVDALQGDFTRIVAARSPLAGRT